MRPIPWIFLSDTIIHAVKNEERLNRAAQLKPHYLVWEVFSTPYSHRQASIDLVQPFFLVFPDPFFAFRRQNLLLILTIGKNALVIKLRHGKVKKYTYFYIFAKELFYPIHT